MFNQDFPNLAFIEAIFMQNIIGKIWVNSDTKIPTSALVVSGGEYCFITGLVPENLFNTYLNVVAKKSDYKIVIHNLK